MSGWDHGSVGKLGGNVHVVQCDVEAGGIRRKGKPAARRGRKATGPTRSAELPNDRERACSEHTLAVSARLSPLPAQVRARVRRPGEIQEATRWLFAVLVLTVEGL